MLTDPNTPSQRRMIAPLINAAIDARAELVDPRHETAFRLFNGFTEGLPALALDIYAQALVIHDYVNQPDGALMASALKTVCERWPWITSAVLKPRQSSDADVRSGRVIMGNEADLPRTIRENGVAYSLNLLLNRDSSFYIDTRGLRAWAKENLAGKRVLNTFAYTGSLGVAARGAPCRQVVTTDLNKRFLTQAKDSFSLNGFPIQRADFITGNFFEVAARLKRNKELFNCVFLDPPFFSTTGKGGVGPKSMKSLINKVRPLVAHEGALAVVNNALFVSGKDYMEMLQSLCGDGYMKIERTIDVPQDFVGYTSGYAAKWPTDPEPFNHPTKIAVLRLTRKDARREIA
jgi:23S rRNA (cytosine1962-C5)-methyltransferase